MFKCSFCFLLFVSLSCFVCNIMPESIANLRKENNDLKFNGYYMYIKASSPHQPGDDAKLYSPPLKFFGIMCLEFYYYMSGASIRSLNVAINETVVFSASGDKGDVWNKASINISSIVGLHWVIFEGVVGSSYTGDIAIDDFSLKAGSCFYDCFIYHFETYQDLTTESALAVEYFAIKGSLFLAFANFGNSTSIIYKFSDSTRKFVLYQTLDTKQFPSHVEYFTISDKYYLAVANPFNTSVIYRWNGQLFTPFENIAAAQVWQFSFFTVDKEPYLAVSSSNSISQCIIYKWKNNTFEKFQVIGGTCSIHAFIIDNETYFAQAGGFHRQGQLVVYKWSGESFSKLQTLPPATEVKFFNINKQMFLAVSSEWGHPNSYIYKWEGSRFILFQSISTLGSWVLCVHSFVMCGQMFLGFTEQGNDKSTLYRFSLDKFTKYQEISTFGPADMTSFEYKGYTYLAIANSGNSAQRSTKSTLYKWTTGM